MGLARSPSHLLLDGKIRRVVSAVNRDLDVDDVRRLFVEAIDDCGCEKHSDSGTDSDDELSLDGLLVIRDDVNNAFYVGHNISFQEM